MKRSPELQEFIDDFAKTSFSWDGISSHCRTCNTPVVRDGLRDEISKMEYDISGMCQACQDSVFCGEDDE